MSTLYIVSTPIGNLEDLTFRALRVLKGVDLILCEDTRVTKKLLNHYQIKTPTLSYYQHSKLKKVEYIIQLLRKGKNLALVSDAGTPGISDPGNKLVNAIITSPGFVTKIVPIPGPSAVTAAASISGFPMDKFIFMGFPPVKKKRKKFFEEIVNSKHSVIFYESPYRIIKSLRELELTAKTYNLKPQIPERQRRVKKRVYPLRLVVCRELTKKFETIYRGKIEEVIKEIEQGEIKGEFVVIVKGK